MCGRKFQATTNDGRYGFPFVVFSPSSHSFHLLFHLSFGVRLTGSSLCIFFFLSLHCPGGLLNISFWTAPLFTEYSRSFQMNSLSIFLLVLTVCLYNYILCAESSFLVWEKIHLWIISQFINSVWNFSLDESLKSTISFIIALDWFFSSGWITIVKIACSQYDYCWS